VQARDRVRLPVLADMLARHARPTGADHAPLSRSRLVAKLAFGDQFLANTLPRRVFPIGNCRRRRAPRGD
jgi:hypothetical protein